MIVDVGEPELQEFSIDVLELFFGKCFPKFIPIQHVGFLNNGDCIREFDNVEVTTYMVHVLNQGMGEGVQVLEEHLGIVFYMPIMHRF